LSAGRSGGAAGSPTGGSHEASYRALGQVDLVRHKRDPKTRRTHRIALVRFHDLRHLVGVTLAEADVPTNVLRAFMHHASRQASEVYTRWISDRVLQDAASKLTSALRRRR
jgi:integrase